MVSQNSNEAEIPKFLDTGRNEEKIMRKPGGE
jgi:hypothetical protein